MGLLKNFLPRISKQKDIHPYLDYFLKVTERKDHPYKMALSSYASLRETAENQDEIFLYMVEDILSSSLYATFYEELLRTVKENPQLSDQLIEAFQADEPKREQIIAEQSQSHLNFLLNDGHCDGCSVCDNHADVAEILPQLKEANIEFFRGLYLGMQTIQFSMEELIYDLLPLKTDWTPYLDQKSITELRKELFKYVENV